MRKALLIASLGVIIGAGTADADLIQLSGVTAGDPPSGAPPWAWAELNPVEVEIHVPGVRDGIFPATEIVMNAGLMQNENEYISRWYFDLVPGLSFDDIFEFLGLSAGGTHAVQSPEGPNHQGIFSEAEPESGMDFYFDFDFPGTALFNQDDWVKWGVIDVRPSDFAGAKALVKGIPTGEGRAWISSSADVQPVPEPGTMLLVSAGLALFGLRKRVLTQEDHG